MALRVLDAVGVRRSVKPMIDCFEGPNHYFTYKGERDPSVSTNAHVLQALVLYSTAGEYSSSVDKCIRYLCKTWWNSRSFVQDKWVGVPNPRGDTAVTNAGLESLGILSNIGGHSGLH